MMTHRLANRDFLFDDICNSSNGDFFKTLASAQIERPQSSASYTESIGRPWGHFVGKQDRVVGLCAATKMHNRIEDRYNRDDRSYEIAGHPTTTSIASISERLQLHSIH